LLLAINTDGIAKAAAPATPVGATLVVFGVRSIIILPLIIDIQTTSGTLIARVVRITTSPA